jgi:hypothetical protein
VWVASFTGSTLIEAETRNRFGEIAGEARVKNGAPPQ